MNFTAKTNDTNCFILAFVEIIKMITNNLNTSIHKFLLSSTPTHILEHFRMKTELHCLSIMQFWEAIQIWECSFMTSTSKIER